MGVSVTHEPPNPPTGDSLENLQTPLNDSGSTSPIIPPTNPPTSGATDLDPKYVALLEGSLREANRRLQQIENNSVTPATPPPPAKTADELRLEFYENPQTATRQLIREELESSVGEIRDFVRQFKGQSAVDKYVDQFKMNPRYSGMWDSTIEQYVREQAVQIPTANLNENTFGFIVISAIGLKATGQFGSNPNPPTNAPPASAPPANQPAPVATQPSSTSSMPTPPHMRPSPPPSAPPASNEPKVRPLNENEQRLLREYNAGKPPEKQMNAAQFLKWQEMPSNEVAFSTLGQPTPPRT